MRKARYTIFCLASALHLAAATTAFGQGSVWAWGWNLNGQLGIGNNTNQTLPQAVNLTGVVAVAGGFDHSLALKSDGTVWAWGANDMGQVPIPTTVPVQVMGLSGVVAIAAGRFHNLALRNDGTVWAWGYNDKGQSALGDCIRSASCPSGIPWSFTPTQVGNLPPAVAIAAGALHSMALLADGTVRTWGWNQYGQLGNETSGEFAGSVVPVQVSGLTEVVAIAGGITNSAALKSDGTMWAWGFNGYGQLGDGTFADSATPVQVSSLTAVKAIGVGAFHGIALKHDGTVWTWGQNYYGVLGRSSSNTPGQVPGLSGVVAIASGEDHNLVIKSDGTVWGWGNNLYGELGNGRDNSYFQTPVQAVGLTGAIAISAGHRYHSLAVKNLQTNTAPIVTANQAFMAVSEGQLAQNSGTFSDSDSGDYVTITASSGSVSQNPAGSSATSGTWSWQQPAADGPASYPVTVTATDSKGAAAVVNFTVSVNNVAPTAIFNTPLNIVEGNSFPLSLTQANDVAADLPALSYAFNCGAGFSAYGSGNTALCMAVDNGAIAVGGMVRDKDGGESIYSSAVLVSNAAPQVVIASPSSGSVYPVNTTVSFAGTFTDAGIADSHVAAWTVGSSTLAGVVTQANGGGTVTGSRTFSAAGVYPVSLSVTDDDGAKGTASTVGGLPAEVVVFDPNAGSVTGNGWFNSPAGAFPQNPTLSGRVQFGFNSRYQRNTALLTGDTTLRIQASKDFEFNSTGYEWLVVTGARAQFKGSGRVNGAGDYRFMITVIDGKLTNGGNGGDRLRIKIWDRATGSVFYDTNRGVNDDAEPTISPGAGSILVQNPGGN
ncbi:MAG: hypothetical protein JNN08_09350 [Bryobacterales bacterium]|nr:hypothetical protein [Bryobacterales bacterium]